MKHLFVLLLALLLTGCATEVPDTGTMPAQPPPPTEITATEPVQQPKKLHSNRALTIFDTGISECQGIYPMGQDMVLISGSDETQLTVLSDNHAHITTQKRLHCQASPEDGSMQINENGIAYYDSVQNAVICLNTDLLETRQILLPDCIRGSVLLAPDWNTLYYCSAQGIHALDLQTGTPRMVRGHRVVSQVLAGLHLNGQVLTCQVCYEDGYSEQLYLSTQTGESYYPGRELDRLYTNDSTYLASFRDGSVNLWLTGKPENSPWMLNVSQSAEVIPLYGTDALIVTERTGNQTELNHLDITTGRLTATITLGLPGEILHMAGNDGIVWFLVPGVDSGKQLLYRWFPAWSRVWSPSSCYKTYYTAEKPNAKELTRLAYRASKLGEQYGISMRIGEDALLHQPTDCTIETEYRIAAYERDLAALEKALSNFPEDFFQNAAVGTRNRKLTVSLVRSIHDETRQETLPGSQYWTEESAYITLVMGDGMVQSFYHQLCHIIDNRVMGTSSAYDDWASMNPDGADYAHSYDLTHTQAEEAWFLGNGRAFTDPYAMTYPREDRARILEYAMTPGNSDVFASETMQRKLSTLCQGIRQAFALEDDFVCLWEQYLITESK